MRNDEFLQLFIIYSSSFIIKQKMMTILKKIFKYIGFFLLFFIVFIGIYWLLAFGLSKIGVEVEATQTTPDIPAFIITNGVHTDIVMPVRTPQIDWSKKMPYSNTVSKDTAMNFLAIGWGDKGFYLETPQWSDLKFSVAFKAAFSLSTSAIHATYYKKMTEDEDYVKMFLTEDQYARLIAYVQASLITDENGDYIFIDTDQMYGKTDAFYDAKGSFNMSYTCNTWTNDALKACGQKAAFWTPFDSGIFGQYK
ncbi:MAG: hypothetical protein ACI9XO_003730 [Paraglaciecola sp.]|jgi:uncharacterized protein (TIGR02117 family)